MFVLPLSWQARQPQGHVNHQHRQRHDWKKAPEVVRASLRVPCFVLEVQLLDKVLLQLVVHPRKVEICVVVVVVGKDITKLTKEKRVSEGYDVRSKSMSAMLRTSQCVNMSPLNSSRKVGYCTFTASSRPSCATAWWTCA
jgi:hypothetical protein